MHSSSLKTNLRYLFILGVLFFIFGFVTWLNGALIPFLQVACELTHMQAYLVTMFFYIAYTVMALPVSRIIGAVGYKRGMSYGLAIMAVGALLFITAAYFRTYSLFLAGLFVLGSGLTLLQTASNPYVVLLGPADSAAARISFMGILNKAAGVIAPLLFSTLVFADMSQFGISELELLSNAEKALKLDELSNRLITPYFFMAIGLALLGLFLSRSPLPEPAHSDRQGSKVPLKGILEFPHLLIGAVTLFFYIGAEVIAGDTIGLVGKHLGVASYAELTAYTMAFMVVGYVVGIVLIPKFLTQQTALMLSAIAGVVLTGLILLTPSDSYILTTELPDVVHLIAMLGLANALVWPAVWPLALRDLGNYTSTGSAFLIMGISGGAILPMIYGAIADFTGDPTTGYCVLLPCYLFIYYFSIVSSPRNTRESVRKV